MHVAGHYWVPFQRDFVLYLRPTPDSKPQSANRTSPILRIAHFPLFPITAKRHYQYYATIAKNFRSRLMEWIKVKNDIWFIYTTWSIHNDESECQNQGS